MTREVSEERRLAMLAEAKKVFFLAMLDGYAGGENKKSIKTTSPDGYKTIEFPHGDFRVVDRYCVTPLSDFSAGSTTIFCHGGSDTWIPIWYMSYSGHYPRTAIPFLKEALLEAYRKKAFHGGRGPEFFLPEREGKFLYTNVVLRGDFYCFVGREQVSRLKVHGEVIGYHQYQGVAMI